MHSTIAKALTALAATSCLLPVLAAPADQDLSAIAKVAEEFAREQFSGYKFDELEITSVSLDGRLRLKACNTELAAYGAATNERAGRTNVEVRCLDEAGWTLSVPVKIAARIGVLTAASALPKGHVLQEADLSIVSRAIQELPSHYLTKPDEVLNKALTRPIQANSLLTMPMLAEPMLINKGQSLTILANGGNYSVKMTGTALGNGTMGQRINVKNASSGKTVQGTIIDAGTVRVNQ
jgi:flagellar basal body P-ring formation protein FlgA